MCVHNNIEWSDQLPPWEELPDWEVELPEWEQLPPWDITTNN